MKKLYLLSIFLTGFGYLQSQTLMTVNPATEYQTIVGMGGHGINADASYIKYIVDYLGITAYRHWIETPLCSDSNYITLANINSGNIVFKDLDASSISFFNTLKSKGVTVIASNWSPPACLKKNRCTIWLVDGVCCKTCPSASWPCDDDNNYLLPEYYDEYARYLSLWTKDFQTKTGISLYALSIQNEPLFNEPYNSALLYSFAYGPALKAVHDTFAKYPELSNIKFFGPEHMSNYGRNNGLNGVGSNYIKSLIDTATFRPYLDAYAVHGYSDGIKPDLTDDNDWKQWYEKIVVQHNKMMWMSETSGESGEWADAYWYMKCMFMAFKSGKVSLWTYWGMDVFYGAGNATRRFYNHLHFYRFVRPGMKMISVTDTDADVEAIGFKNGSDVTVLAINISKTADKTIQFSDFPGKPAFYHVYRSTSMEMCSYVGKVTDNTFILPKESVVTITYNSTSPDITYGPLAPANLTATKISDNSITVTWTAASSWTLSGSPVTIAGYIVYINGLKKTMTPTSATTYTFNGLTKGTTYNIQVYTRDAMINQSVAAPLSVTTTCDAGDCLPPCCGPALNDAQILLTVTPNPACEMFSVEMPDNGIYSLTMIDITGKIVLAKQNVIGRETIDISGLAKGIYFVMANNNGRIYKAKVAVE